MRGIHTQQYTMSVCTSPPMSVVRVHMMVCSLVADKRRYSGVMKHIMKMGAFYTTNIHQYATNIDHHTYTYTHVHVRDMYTRCTTIIDVIEVHAKC